MAENQLAGQFDIFDFVYEEPTVAPMLSAGDTVYVLTLDRIQRGIIGRSWLCGGKYYGYDVSFDCGGRTTIWDNRIGKEVFRVESQAVAVARETCYEKINLEPSDLVDAISCSYVREIDSYRLKAILGKVGDTQLYEGDFMCYRFLRSYTDEKKRDAAYNSMRKKILRESEECDGEEWTVTTETLYKISSSLYASHGYAEHNLNWRS